MLDLLEIHVLVNVRQVDLLSARSGRGWSGGR